MRTAITHLVIAIALVLPLLLATAGTYTTSVAKALKTEA